MQYHISFCISKINIKVGKKKTSQTTFLEIFFVVYIKGVTFLRCFSFFAWWALYLQSIIESSQPSETNALVLSPFYKRGNWEMECLETCPKSLSREVAELEFIERSILFYPLNS